MKYTTKNLVGSVKEIEVTLDHPEFLAYWQQAYDEALSKVHLKGFRPGAAPKDLADKAVDKDHVFHEATNDAVRVVLKEINAENNWTLVDQPRVEVLESDPSANIGLKFKATLTVFPEVKLGNYEKVVRKIIADAPKDFPIDEKEVEKNVQWVLNSRAKLTRVTREAKLGDVADIDFSGFIDGKPLDGASGKADSFVLGEGKFVPGFEEYIVGHKENESFEFSVNFPADYWKEELRNKKVDFKVTLVAVYEREVPALTDEFVKGLGKFDTVDGLKNTIREGLKKEKEEKEKEILRLKMTDAIVKEAKIDLPQVMVDHTLENMVEEYKALRRNAPSEESDADIRKRLEEKAKHSVATNLVLYQIAKDRQLEPLPEEVEAESNKFLAHSEFSRNPKIDPQKVYDYSYGIVQNRKVFEYLESLK
jgi:trigger factor